MTTQSALPVLPEQADITTCIDWLEQALSQLEINHQPLKPLLAKIEESELHQLLPQLLPERSIVLQVSPFHPHQVSRDNRYFAEQWQQLATAAGIELEALEQRWSNFEKGQLEVHFNFQGQSFCYRYNLCNFDLEPDLHQFCDRYLSDQLYGCHSDEVEQSFVLLPEELIEQLRSLRSPHWWRVR